MIRKYAAKYMIIQKGRFSYTWRVSGHSYDIKRIAFVFNK